MKQLIFIIFIFISINSFSQKIDYFDAKSKTEKKELTTLYINKDVTLHFRSPEIINYVDISSDNLVGDIPIENIAKFKLVSDSSYKQYENIGIITIVGQTYLAQYNIIFSDNNDVTTDKEIVPHEMQPLQFPSIDITEREFKLYAMNMLKKKRRFLSVRDKDMRLKIFLNNIYAWGDFIFVDVTIENNTNLKYDFDYINFSIQDKKIYKETNVQRIDIKPLFQMYTNKSFKHSYRNIYLFKKFTLPNDKVLNMTIYEKQISGRTISLDINYDYLLNADTF